MATLKSIKNKYLTLSDGTVLGVATNTENISALSFKLATADSLSKFNLVDGFADDYNDDTGVDAAASTDEVRNAANYYSATATEESYVATGGGAGGNRSNTDTLHDGAPGGSGGGGGTTSGDGHQTSGGTSTQASYPGWVAFASGGGVGQHVGGSHEGGGGGGGGNPGGSNGSNFSGGNGGPGAAGYETGISGSSIYYAGGGGATGNSPGSGGSGSGSTANRGGGGSSQTTNGGSGIIWLQWTPSGGSQTETSFTADGQWTVPASTTQVDVFMVGGGGPGGKGGSSGGGGGGGVLRHTTFAVTPGIVWDITIGAGGVATGSESTMGTNGGDTIFANSTYAATMDLRSNVFTAQTVPTTARIVLDEESYKGLTTLNTDIKAYASRDNGTTYTQVTLADQGQLNYLAGIDSYTKLMLHCDGSNGGTTFTDSSATGHTMTPDGNVHTDTAIKKFGTASAQFDGTTDYITSAASTEFSFTGDFTIDCWCYFSAINTTIAYSQANADWNSASTNDWILLVDGGGNVTFNVKNVGGISSAGHGALNVWKHIAVERASATSKLYVDGALTATSTGPGSGTVSTNNIVALGRASTNLTGGYNGYIDEFRISKGIARYGAAFTPPATPYEHSRRLLSGSVDISGQPSGTNMKYKLETLNQSATKETRVYGTSMAWA